MYVLSVLEQIKNRVIGSFSSKIHRIIIVSDHGTSRMAVMVRNTEYDNVLSKPENIDIYKYGRYSNDTAPQVAFISGFGLRRGAIASTIAHDCHNLIAVGVDDCSITKAMNRLIQEKGGIAVCDGDNVDVLPLPVAGLMSPESAEKVAGAYVRLNHKTRELGCRLSSPFMTLSFMALPVIPHLKLTDKGLFDFSKFGFVEM